jgi:hypothetical protein
MSESTDTPNKGHVEAESDAEKPETISIDDAKQTTSDYRNQRKTRSYEVTVNGEEVTFWFEYRMLTEDEKNEIVDETITQKPTRNGQENQIDQDVSQTRVLFIKNGVTDTNIEGFTTNERTIKSAIPDPVREDLGDSIADFSEMPESERLSFR